MGSSSGGAGDPRFLSQGGTPIPGLPIAGQGAPNDDPHKFGTYQNFLPDIPPAGQGPAPLARGLTKEMFDYKGLQGSPAPAAASSVTNSGANTGPSSGAGGNDASAMRSQLASLQSRNSPAPAAVNSAGVIFDPNSWFNQPQTSRPIGSIFSTEGAPGFTY